MDGAREKDEVDGPRRIQGDLPRVVAIGASAGGLKSFERLLENLPANTGLAFVFIVHLHPAHETLLPSLLSKCTPMPVQEAEDGMRVERDHVYVIPRNADITIKKGVLHLSKRVTTQLPHHPIDGFMRSLIEDGRNDAIGVILSGTGSDGTLGLQQIKAKGGITFAESKNSATYHEMPQHATEAGSVDFELTAVQIAKELAGLGDHSVIHRVEGGKLPRNGFFQHPETFAALKTSLFPTVLSGRAGGKPLRVWFPECGTGEDVYSTAITFLEFTESRAEHIPIQIFGTDSDLKMLEAARNGIYSQDIVHHVSPERLSRFFVKQGINYQIGRTVRSQCLFARQSLADEPPLSQIDLIIFRKPLHDLVPALRQRVMRNLHYSLKPAGLLVLGCQEKGQLFRTLFTLQDKKHMIYSRNQVRSVAGMMPHELRAELTYTSAAEQYQVAGEEQLKTANEELRISLEKLACLNENSRSPTRNCERRTKSSPRAMKRSGRSMQISKICSRASRYPS